MTAAAVPGTLTPKTTENSTENSTETETAERYVETYFADGMWHSRRHDSEQPFASGAVLVEQIAVGAEVARWNQVRHIVRHPDGTVEISH